MQLRKGLMFDDSSRPAARPHLVLAVGVGPEVHLLPLGHLARVHVRAALVAGHARVASERHCLLLLLSHRTEAGLI